MLYKEIVKKISVSAEKKLKQKKYLKEGLFEVVDQGQSLVGGYSNDSNLIVKCDLPVIVFGDHTKCVKFIDFPFVAGADGVKVLRAKEGVDSKYLYYYTLLLTKKMVDKGYARHYQFLEKMEVDVPSLPEQKRIVNKTEELFSELDSAVKTLKKTKEQLAVYRQSVLKEAFESQKDCRSVPISEITDDIRIGPFGTMLHKEDYILNGIPVINPQHIKSGRICPSPKVSISKEKMKELSSYQLKKNDIVMGRRGEMGRCAAVTDVENGWLCGTGSILFRLKSDFDAEFYSKILSSPNVVHYLEENATGTTMKNLNEEIVKQVPVPYMTKRMQQKIHSKIETSLSICENIEKTVNDALAQAEAMRQSILKKAFEGGL